ncbi:MAG TPA: hypothetical protein VD994_17330 [Prosthecobacter sp.]|nr:hypothetical protein [Prosthecobacter sp.]
MTSLDPQPRLPVMRAVTLAVAVLALFTAVTGVVASLTLLAWAVAVIAAVTFAASFYLKADL